MPITTPSAALISALVSAPAMADAIRWAEVEHLASASTVERDALDQERQRLVVKYGAASPQAMAATTRLAWLDTERLGIDAEVVRATIQAPETSTNRFIVYGRVLDAAGGGSTGITVAAVAPNGTALAQGVSDERGVFAVQVPVHAAPPLGSGGETEPSAGTPVLFQLQITSHQLRLFFKDDEIFEAVEVSWHIAKLLRPGLQEGESIKLVMYQLN